jgi:hypothetical protein
MKKELKALIGVISLLVASVIAVNCDSIDTAFDCQAVCSRYRDCFNASYDVDACRSSCRTRAASDPNVKGAADTCQACIDDKSCASATFSCGSSCASIVP